MVVAVSLGENSRGGVAVVCRLDSKAGGMFENPSVAASLQALALITPQSTR